MSAQAIVRVILAFLAVLAVAGAIVVAILPLPSPAAGGSCGQGSSSEPAIVAFFAPNTIGAGPKPPASDPTAQSQWGTFVAECQSSTDSRMTIAGVLLVLSAFLAFFAPILLRRFLAVDAGTGPTNPPAGWYDEPGQPGTQRWWDGQTWGPRAPPPP